MPTYYQACKGSSPLRSGVLFLAVSTTLGPVLIFTGASIQATKVYRPQLYIGWVLQVISMGLMTTVHADTPLSHSIGFSILIAFGSGIVYTTTYFPVLAPLPVSENAHALAFFSCCRSFAAVSHKHSLPHTFSNTQALS